MHRWTKSRPRCSARRSTLKPSRPMSASADPRTEALSLDFYVDRLREIEPAPISGHVSRVVGLVVESIGPRARVGEVCELRGAGAPLPLEIVGFRDGRMLS